ncbi:MAG: hypothetical protein K2G90_10645 [Muribaculaceae bacterium]|nr:hypothetical protein [Muribaculaceae bacterium]
MKNLIISVCVAICALFGANKGIAQSIPASMLPYMVSEMKKQCPQKASTGMMMTNVYLENNNSAMVFELTINEKEIGVNSSQMIKEFQEMSPDQKKYHLGTDFSEIVSMIPAPIYFHYKFTDGKSYKMKVSD